MSYDTVLKTIRKHNRKVFCYSTCRVFENDFDYIKIYCTPTPWVKKVCHYYFYDNFVKCKQFFNNPFTVEFRK